MSGRIYQGIECPYHTHMCYQVLKSIYKVSEIKCGEVLAVGNQTSFFMDGCICFTHNAHIRKVDINSPARDST